MARRVDVGDQREGDGDDEGQHDQQQAARRGAPQAVADHRAAGDGDQHHQQARRRGDAVPPRRLGVALAVQHVVHAGHHQRRHGIGRRRRRAGGRQHGGPKCCLQLGGLGIDGGHLGRIGRVEAHALLGVLPQQRAHLGGGLGGQQLGAQVFGADRVGLGLLVGLALVVARAGHRETEADQQPQQGERGRQDHVEVLALLRAERPAPAQRGADRRRRPQAEERQHQDGRRPVRDVLQHGRSTATASPG